MPNYNDVFEARKLLWESLSRHYFSVELFSGRWLFLLSVAFVSYIVWIKILDKSRLNELLLIGSFGAVSFTFFDLLLTTMLLYSHKTRIFPTVPSLFATDYTIFPVSVMIVKQFCNTWKKYLIGSAISSSFISFIIFPIYVAVGTMALNKISYYHIFLLSYILSIFSLIAYNWVAKIQQINT